MEMLNYEDFVDYCRNSLLKVLGNSYETYQTKFEVSDLKSYDSLVFHKKGESGLELSYRMEELFMDYRDGLSLGNVILKMLKLHENQLDNIPDYSFLNNISEYDVAKYRLVIRAISLTDNEKLLEKYYYKKIGDIALVVYSYLGEKGDQLVTTKINKTILEKYEMPFEEIYENALKNTARLFRPILQPLSSLIATNFANGPEREEKFGFMNPDCNLLIRNVSEVHVLNTTNQLNGATALFYEGVLPKIAKLFNDDLVLSFTSIHEAMIHSAKYMPEREIKKLAAGMRKTRGTASNGTEFLSDKAYRYYRQSGELKVIS